MRVDVEALADELNALAGEPVTEPARVVCPQPADGGRGRELPVLSRSAVDELMRAGQLSSVPIGARGRVPVAAVDAYVAQITGAA